MNRATARSRRHQGGFTLIELLVVIIILGILSAVVVFAVRGSGDKGKQNAVATDARIVRTALETYCAQKGHYPAAEPATPGRKTAMEVLVTDKFLSSASTYTPLSTGDDPALFPEGNCGTGGANGPSHYQLPAVNPLPATTTTTGQPPTCPVLDRFCQLDTAPAGTFSPNSPTFSLRSGKVLAFTEAPHVNGVSEYDPALGSAGAWSKVADYDESLGWGQARLVIGSRPPPYSDCGQMCDKVLMHLHGGGWIVYDPVNRQWLSTLPGSSDPGGPFGGRGNALAAQILGEPCGQYCGNVLMVYCCGPGRVGGDFAELWDPKTGVFTPVGYLGGSVGRPDGPNLAQSVVALRNGQVLVTTAQRYVANTRTWTKIFDPTVGKFLNGDDHSVSHEGVPMVLGNGDVLFSDGTTDTPTTAAEVFHVGAPPGLGLQWGPASLLCGTPTAVCSPLSTFPIGGVPGAGLLALTVAPDGTRTGWRVDSRQPPQTWSWTKAAGGPHGSIGNSVVIGGACTKHCGKIVTASDGRSELYSPPP